jgi:hypothetical protein
VLTPNSEEVGQGAVDSFESFVENGLIQRYAARWMGCLDKDDSFESFVNTSLIQRYAARWMGCLGTLTSKTTAPNLMLRDVPTTPTDSTAPLPYTLDLSSNNAVFLGGSCGTTTWRAGLAIPTFEAAGISYYNPQVDDWTPSLVAIEAYHKEHAKILLFVIDDSTRSLVSVLESVEAICKGRRCFIVMAHEMKGQIDFDGDGNLASLAELADVNRLRRYLKDVAARHGVPIFEQLEDAIRGICKVHVQGTASSC